MARWIAVMGLALVLAGCARREVAYRFRAPLVSAVYAAPLPAPHLAGDEPDTGVDTRIQDRIDDLPAPHRGPTNSLVATDGQDPNASQAHEPGPGAAPVTGNVVQTLRALVGRRESRLSHLEFALYALEAIGVRLGDEARAHKSGAAFVAWAEGRDALSRDAPLPGDLIVFDRVLDGEPASLIGVVVGRAQSRDPGDTATVEFVYLARGVVRRGYVSPGRPAQKRDQAGRALNTFVRHLDEKSSKNDEFLAGELFRTYLRIDRLPHARLPHARLPR